MRPWRCEQLFLSDQCALLERLFATLSPSSVWISPGLTLDRLQF